MLQAITIRSGRWSAISSPISGDDALDQRRLALLAIGKEGVVGDVDVARVRPRLGDLAEDREAAEPGIEDKDGRQGRHGDRWYEKTGRAATAGMCRQQGGVSPCRSPARGAKPQQPGSEVDALTASWPGFDPAIHVFDRTSKKYVGRNSERSERIAPLSRWRNTRRFAPLFRPTGYIKATVGFEKLGRATDTPPKSPIRMFGPRGNPQAKNLFSVIGYLQKRAGVQLHVSG